MKVEKWNFITREDCRRNPDKIFLFGDNLERAGFGGQAKEMRGEVNAIGIPTKKKPSNSPDSFFSDDEFEQNRQAITKAFASIPKNKTIVVPAAGLGTGLAKLSQRAPRTFEFLQEKLKELENED